MSLTPPGTDAIININSTHWIEWRKDGIFETKMKGDKQTTSQLWKWDKLIIQGVWVDLQKKRRYDFRYQYEDWIDMPMSAMTDIVAETSLIRKMNRKMFGPLVHEYVKNKEIPIQHYAKVCGYIDGAWATTLTNRFETSDSIQQDTIQGLEATFSMDVDLKDAHSNMQVLYDAMEIENKDIVMAIGMILPFQHELLKHTKMKPYYTFYSHEAETGKTEAAKLITTNWWNTSDDVHPTDAVGSESRFGTLGTGTTFCRVVDDCGEMEKKVKGTIKTSQTGYAHWIRKNRDNTIKFDRIYTSPWIFTLNELHSMYDDDAFLTRQLVIPFRKVHNNHSKEIFINAQQPNGYFGNIIYQILKEITFDDLTTLYDEQPTIGHNGRKNVIYRLISMGSALFERVFGITLNIEAVMGYINETVDITGDELYDAVVALIDNADKHKMDRPNWIQNDLLIHTRRKGKRGYLITNLNKNDVCRYIKSKYSMPALQKRLLKLFPKHVIDTDIKIPFSNNGRKIKGILYMINEIIPEPTYTAADNPDNMIPLKCEVSDE